MTNYSDQIASNFDFLLRKNKIINGNFDIWQRATSGSDGYCSADRWYLHLSGATASLSQQTFTLGQTNVPGEPKYFARVTCTVANDNVSLLQKIEGVNTLAGQTSTLSFWVKADSTCTLTFLTIQHFGTGGSPSSDNQQTHTNFNITTSWQKFTYTFIPDSISGKTLGTDGNDSLCIWFQNQNNETFTIDFSKVQVEKGAVATDFEERHISEELLLCQRYCIVIGTTEGLMFGVTGSSNTIGLKIVLPQTLRDIPSMSFDGQIDCRYGGNGYSIISSEISSINLASGGIRVGTTQSGAGNNTGGYVSINNNQIVLDSEL